MNNPLHRLLRLAAGIVFFVPVTVFAQPPQQPNMDNYKPARSNGPLPPEFTTPTIQKYEKAKANIQTTDKEMQKAEELFYLQTNYSVDQMRFSGSVLVNDTMGQYVNRVADTLLLRQDPELRKKLNFYVLRSPVVNAFATDQGAIFVTVGLLTRLHNEAELAYVLAHEIIHYKRHHVLTGYVEGVKAREGIGQYEATTYENRFLKRHRYARSQESQADEEGFELLLASNYDPRAAIGAFDILAMADHPFSDTTFSKSFFETEYLAFPSKFQPDTVKAPEPQDEDEDDDLATHPSVYKRRKAMIRRFNKAADTTGSKYLVSETQFWRIKTMARFEEISEHTAGGEFNASLYSNYAMQKHYPDNRYLEKEMVRTLYASVIKKNRMFSYDDLSELLQMLFTGAFEDDEKPVGEQGRLNAFVRKTDAAGWNVAALQYAWTIHERYPDDPDITLWCEGLFRELTVKNELRMDDFETSDSTFFVIGNKAAADSTIAKKLKGDTPLARFQGAVDHLDRDSLEDFHYWQYAFVDHLEDSAFVQLFRAAILYADSLELDDSLWDDKSSKERKAIRKEEKEDVYGPQGMSKVVAVNPIFIAYDDREANFDMDVLKTLDGRAMLIGEMKASAQRLSMDIAVLDADGIDSGSVDRFNDLVTASEWFDQRSDYGDNQILPYPQEEMKKLAAKYGTNYFMWSAYITETSKRRGTVMRALSLVALPLAPHIAYRLATPRQNVYYIAIIYDITTGKPVFVQRTEMTNQRPTKSRMRLHVFDLMRTLSTPKKAKQ